MKLLTLLTLTLAFVLFAPLHGADYFVSPTGSDSGMGTLADPINLRCLLGLTAATTPNVCTNVTLPSTGGWRLFLLDGLTLTDRSQWDALPNCTAVNPCQVSNYPGAIAGVDTYVEYTLAQPINFTTCCGSGAGCSGQNIVLTNVGALRVNDTLAIGWSTSSEGEQLRILGFSGNSITSCLRGINGTTSVTHTTAEKVTRHNASTIISNPYTRFMGIGHPLRYTRNGGVQWSTRSNNNAALGRPHPDGRTTHFMGGQLSDGENWNIAITNGSDGIGSNGAIPDGEIGVNYGLYLYLNGTCGTDRGHGHGYYAMNSSTTGIKRMENYISFRNFATGGKCFGVTGFCNNFQVRHAISFNHQEPCTPPGNPTGLAANLLETNILIGPDSQSANNMEVTDSTFFSNPTATVADGTAHFGRFELNGALIQRNYFVGGSSPVLFQRSTSTGGTLMQNVTFTNNFVYGGSGTDQLIQAQVSGSAWPTWTINNNTYFSQVSGSTKYFSRNMRNGGPMNGHLCTSAIRWSDAHNAAACSGTGSAGWLEWLTVRGAVGADVASTYAETLPTSDVITYHPYPNDKEKGRCHVHMLTFSAATTANLDLSQCNWVAGDHYEVVDAQNLFGSPIASGEYTGAAVNITIPDDTSPAEQPGGAYFTTLAHTIKMINALVVRRKIEFAAASFNIENTVSGATKLRVLSGLHSSALYWPEQIVNCAFGNTCLVQPPLHLIGHMTYRVEFLDASDNVLNSTAAFEVLSGEPPIDPDPPTIPRLRINGVVTVGGTVSVP